MLTNRKEIFFILGSLKLGGTERTATRIGLELLKRGYPIRFILLKSVFDYKDENILKNVVSLESERYKIRVIKLVVTYFKLLRVIWKYRPDKVVSFSVGINILIFFTFYSKLIFRIETNIFVLRKSWYKRVFQKYLSVFGNVQKIIIPSKGLMDACRSYFLNTNNLILVSNPVGVGEIKKLAEESISNHVFAHVDFIVSAGRLVGMKGFEQLVSVFSTSAVLENCHLVILGDGPDRQIIEKIIQSKGIVDRVHLMGFVDNPYKYISKSKYLVLNSSFESFGNVLIEAFACGVPVVSNNCDFGPRDIVVPGYNGILYNKSNETDFLQAIELPFKNSDDYAILRNGARKSAHEFEIESIAEVWENEILTKKREK
jgi:glycosyltransferase involved in cell wall biosynthesis